MDKENLLVKGLSELGLTITEEQIEKFDKYYEMLIETNKVMNLTSITEYDEVIIKHFIDSLLVVNIFDINQSKKNDRCWNRGRFSRYSNKNNVSTLTNNIIRLIK